METQPQSPAVPVAEEVVPARSTTTGLAKRPITKPVAPRLTTSTASTRPSATSRTTSTAAQTSLNKPPTRPIATSTARKPTSSSVARTPGTLHAPQLSTTSVDTSGDESKRDGITAKPKRMSVASSTSAAAAQRLSATKPGVTASARKTSTTPTPTRPSITSPTSAAKRQPTSSIRTSSTLTSRARPPSATSSRTVGLADRKRLSTIPASPAVKSGRTIPNENHKDVEHQSDQILSDAEPAEKESRAGSLDAGTTDESNDAAQEIERLREQLEQSRNEVAQLQAHIDEVESKPEIQNEKAAEGISIAAPEPTILQARHDSDMKELLAKHQSTIDEMASSHRAELDSVTQAHLEELKKITDTGAENVDKQKVEFQALQTELEKSMAQTIQKHTTQITELKTEHESATHLLKERVDNFEKELALKQDEITKMADDHDQVQEELQSLQGAQRASEKHKDSVIDKLEAQLASATRTGEMQDQEASAAALKMAQDLESTMDELEAVRKDHDEAVVRLRSEFESDKDTALRALVAEHKKELSGINSELSQKHDVVIERLKATHAKELHLLEQQSKSVLTDLEELETSNASELEKVKAEERASHAKALQESTEVHTAEIRQLESRLELMQSEFSKAKQDHELELVSLRTEHDAQRESKLAELSSEHDKKLAELRSNFSGEQASVLADLKKDHAEQIKQLESQLKSASDDSEAAKFQIQTVKAVLADVEREITQNKESHEKEMAKLQDEFSQAVVKLSVQSEKLLLQDSQLQESRATAESEKENAINATKQQHDKAVQTLRNDLLTEHKSNIESLQLNHAKVLETIKSEKDLREQTIGQLKSTHDQVVAEMQASWETGHKKALDQAKAAHAKTLDDLRGSLEAQHEDAVRELQQHHESKSAEQLRQRTDSLERVKEEHDQVVARLQSQMDELQLRSQDSSEVDSLRAQLRDSQKSVKTMEETRTKTVSDMSAEHGLEIKKLQDESKVAEANSESKLGALQTQLAELQGKHEVLTMELTKKRNEHETQLDQARTSSASAANSEAEEIKSLLREAKKTISDLSEQYANAALEAEDQRLAAENAQRELAELKKSLLKAEASPIPTIKPASTKEVSASPIDKSSPNPGLKASRWATDELKTPSKVAGDENSAQPAGKSDSEKSKKRNIHGQLAGMQESIRQLDDMSAGLLEENQRMAKILSKVDSNGTMNGVMIQDVEK